MHETSAVQLEIPPLEPGDRLTRAEFEKRYTAMPGLKKAELIEGVVYMPSPVRHSRHGQPHFHLIGWLLAYSAHTPGVQGGDNSTIRLNDENVPQPDALLLIDPARGGQAKLSADDYLEGPPELVAEIASSSASFDLHTKLRVYCQAGVREYLVWRVLEQQFDWFVLRGETYQRLPISETGIVQSETFPGLWLAVSALLQGDMGSVLSVAQQGLMSLEHADFVRKLNSPTGPDR